MSIRSRLLIIGASTLLATQALAADRLTLRIGDQKGNMRAQLEAADALRDLPYDIQWAEFPAAAPLAEALNAGAIDAGIIGDAPLLFLVAEPGPIVEGDIHLDLVSNLRQRITLVVLHVGRTQHFMSLRQRVQKVGHGAKIILAACLPCLIIIAIAVMLNAPF